MTIDLSNKKYATISEEVIRNKNIVITRNGNYYAEDGYTGLGLVQVQLPFEQITVDPSIEQQTIYPTSGYEAISQITVNPVTSTIDENIKSENIKKDVTILGVTGSIEFLTEDTTINPSTTIQNITPTMDGFYNITVNPVTASIDENIKSGNIKEGVTILGITGSCGEARLTTLETTENGTHIPPAPYNGFSEVSVNVNTVNNIDLIVTENGTYNPVSPYNGFSSVTVNIPQPSGTINITEDGIYDVTDYASANVSVISNSYNIPRTLKNGKLTSQGITTFKLPSDVTNLSDYALYYAFENCTSLTSVDLSSLTTVNGQKALTNAFRQCINLALIDLSNLTEISGQDAFHDAFEGCTSLTSVDLSSLTTVNTSGLSHAFENCTSLTLVDLSSLTEINGQGGLGGAFKNCTSLTSISFPNLNTINDSSLSVAFRDCSSLTTVDLSNLTTVNAEYVLYSAFSGCSSLTSISFPSLNSNSFGSYTNQFYKMLQQTTGCTVHFPSNLQSIIGSWSDVTSGFDGTNTTVLFDLPATS